MKPIKICPLCRSSFTDLSLSYCLSDGTPLSEPEGSEDSNVFEDHSDPEEITQMRLRGDFSNSHNAFAEGLISKIGEHTTKQPHKFSRRHLDSWTYVKSARTKDLYPVLDSKPSNGRAYDSWTSSDYVRDITYQMTGYQTFHAQENLELLRFFLNLFIASETKKLRMSTWSSGRANFYSYEDTFSYDFKEKSAPRLSGFLIAFIGFLNR